ncbi:DUF2029 domain-containing protein [Phycicoccus sp. KQZ13P-1]|uniref:glycosyltransferase 87 family protein n=1 Tax=Phycicoccus mangrovi TaxID=2840470 RepID=UPI001C007A6A|nr:glycosyltransferase 87 family protein [Phycicoccus mangrovi]MBT9254430.1 DUF2029 domain-containing protein [Phycicoccus mangrovi]
MVLEAGGERDLRRSDANRVCCRVLIGVAVLAVVVRLVPTLMHGGWLGLGRYDDGVYLGISMSLLHGQLPYRDLVMLHPPGVVLALAPFAAIAGPFGDPVALVVGKVVVMLAGGVAAALVTWLIRDRGSAAMWAAGATYAVFVPAVYADSSLTLEALPNLLLAGALALSVGVHRPQARQLWAAGALLGVATATKIWGVVPLLVIVAFLWHRDGRAVGGRILLGAVGTVTAVCLPFFAAAPAAMWRMVVLDQLGRPDGNRGLAIRLPELFGLPRYEGHGGPYTQALTWAVFVIVAAVLVAVVMRTVRARLALPVALLLACTAVLVVSPSHFLQYGALLAVPLAWCIGAAVGRGWSRRVLVGALAVSATMSLTLGTGRTVAPRFTAAVQAVDGCLTTDDPTVLIATDTLSRNLELGCTTWIDVTGTTYDLPGVRPSRGFYQERRTNGSWHDAVNPYLETGDGMILGRPSTGIHPDVLTYWANATNTTSSSRYTLYDRTCADQPTYRTRAWLTWAMSTTEGVDAALAKVTSPCPWGATDPGTTSAHRL